MHQRRRLTDTCGYAGLFDQVLPKVQSLPASAGGSGALNSNKPKTVPSVSNATNE